MSERWRRASSDLSRRWFSAKRAGMTAIVACQWRTQQTAAGRAPLCPRFSHSPTNWRAHSSMISLATQMQVEATAEGCTPSQARAAGAPARADRERTGRPAHAPPAGPSTTDISTSQQQPPTDTSLAQLVPAPAAKAASTGAEADDFFELFHFETVPLGLAQPIESVPQEDSDDEDDTDSECDDDHVATGPTSRPSAKKRGGKFGPRPREVFADLPAYYHAQAFSDQANRWKKACRCGKDCTRTHPAFRSGDVILKWQTRMRHKKPKERYRRLIALNESPEVHGTLIWFNSSDTEVNRSLFRSVHPSRRRSNRATKAPGASHLT
jgi:hypothetical protein